MWPITADMSDDHSVVSVTCENWRFINVNFILPDVFSLRLFIYLFLISSPIALKVAPDTFHYGFSELAFLSFKKGL